MSTAYYWRAAPRTPTGRVLRRDAICFQTSRFYFRGERPGMNCDDANEEREAVLALCRGRMRDEKVVVDEYGNEYTGEQFAALVEALS